MVAASGGGRAGGPLVLDQQQQASLDRTPLNTPYLFGGEPSPGGTTSFWQSTMCPRSTEPSAALLVHVGACMRLRGAPEVLVRRSRLVRMQCSLNTAAP